MTLDRSDAPVEIPAVVFQHSRKDCRLVAPEAFAQIGLRFRKACDIEDAIVPSPGVRPDNLAEIVVADPDEFSDCGVSLHYCCVVHRIVVCLGAEKYPVRVAGMFRKIEAVLVDSVNVVVAGDVEQVHKAVGIGPDEEVAGCSHRP